MELEKLAEELEKIKLAKEEKEKKATIPKEIIRKIVSFANEARKHYGEIVKSIVVFGSVARGDATEKSDADIFVILDDTATKSSEDLEKVNSHLYLIAHELKNLHIQTHTLTEFWSWIKIGSPELVNFLRYGLVIHDTGFVKPIQRLLASGLIPPSEEAITLKAKSAEARMKKIDLDLKTIIFDLRYSATDIIQAVVMHYYKAQPDQKAIPNYLEKLVSEKKLEREYIEKFKELDKLWKDIDHEVIKKVNVKHLAKALKLTNEILKRFKELLPEGILKGD
jgi:predicted nucleotidyltransferase